MADEMGRLVVVDGGGDLAGKSLNAKGGEISVGRRVEQLKSKTPTERGAAPAKASGRV